MLRYAVPRPASLAVSNTPQGNQPVAEQTCEHGLTQAVAERCRHRWLEGNREAMDAWNGHVAQHGLPLAAYRQV